jgi:hypothetical protein
MNYHSEGPAWFAYVFPFIFVAGWLLVSAGVSEASGWRRLAKRFPAQMKPKKGNADGTISLGHGVGRQYGMYNLIATRSGLFIEVNLLFRFLHPPVMVPWKEVQPVDGGKYLWWHYRELYLASEFTIQIYERQHQAIASFISTDSP